MTEEVILNRTKAYDFCNVEERGEWLDVFVALMQYLLSGESKVGFLNNQHPWNLIHKVHHDFIFASVNNDSKLNPIKWQKKTRIHKARILRTEI
jgi:hypothetical protein